MTIQLDPKHSAEAASFDETASGCVTSCGAILFQHPLDDILAIDQLKWLIIQHTPTHFGFPKGRMEAEETEIQTARREVAEEVGLDFCPISGFRVVDRYHIRPTLERCIVYFLASVDPGAHLHLQPDEIHAAHWLKTEAVIGCLTFSGDQACFRAACQFLVDQKMVLPRGDSDEAPSTKCNGN